MSIKDKLKTMDCIRRPIKKMKVWREYIRDAKSFTKYYMEESDRKNDYEYRALMLVHNIEKGLCSMNPRPFGKKKIIELIDIVKYSEQRPNDKKKSYYSMALSIMFQWVKYYEEHNWDDDLLLVVKTFLSTRGIEPIKDITGTMTLAAETIEPKTKDFDSILETRRSVRTFQNKNVDEDVIRDCVKLAQTAPTACNRQMVHIIHVVDRHICNIITDTIYGSSGITRDTVTYFLITYDIKSLDYYGERNQGFLNAGLVAMNFVNSLHSRGISTCFLQWANTKTEEKQLRNAIKLQENEIIAVVIAAGYCTETVQVAKSHRISIDEIYRKI